MKTLRIIIPALLFVFIFTACNNNSSEKQPDEKETKGKKEEVKKDKKSEEKSDEKPPLPNQKEVESLLKDFNVPIYEGAEFDKIQHDKYGDGYTARYFIPDSSDQKLDEVHSFYDSVVAENFPSEKFNRIDNRNQIIIQKDDQSYFDVSNVRVLTTKKHLLSFGLEFEY